MLIVATALAGFGLGLRIGMFGLIAASLALAISLPLGLVLVAGVGLSQAAITTGLALAAFELASFASMLARHAAASAPALSSRRASHERASRGARTPARPA
jgi:hypothetical protein